MRIAVLWVVLATGTAVLVGMLDAARRHRAQVELFARANATEYVWLAIPWVIVALSVAPAVRRVLAAE